MTTPDQFDARLYALMSVAATFESEGKVTPAEAIEKAFLFEFLVRKELEHRENALHHRALPKVTGA